MYGNTPVVDVGISGGAYWLIYELTVMANLQLAGVVTPGVTHVAGTSAGAVVAALFCAGVNLYEFRDYVYLQGGAALGDLPILERFIPNGTAFLKWCVLRCAARRNEPSHPPSACAQPGARVHPSHHAP